MKKEILLLLIVFSYSLVFSQQINEFHYENISTDVGEFIEIFIPDDGCLYKVEFYRDNGTVYEDSANQTCSSPITDICGQTGVDGCLINIPQSGIQNGPADGFALIQDCSGTITVVDLLSYEGTFTGAAGTNAVGLTSTDVGVSQSNSTTPVGSSIALTTSGWANDTDDTPGACNNSQGPLPVELLFFNLSPINYDISLKWQTASEINNSHFQVEHSTTGQDFETIGEIDGAGTTFEVQDYFFIHETPAVGINYYRLKQVDFDGIFEYSKTISTVVKGTDDWNLRPTQSREEIVVNWSEDFSAKAVSVFDLNGKLVFDKKLDFESEQLRIETSNLSVGTYILKMQTDRAVSSKRFFKIQ